MLTLKVTDGNGERIVTAKPYVVMLWERKTKQKASDLAKGIGFDDMALMAYEALKLDGETLPQFDVWARNLTALEVVSEAAPSPTQAAASTGE